MTSRQTIRGAHYGFSAVRIDELGATEYTLATLVADESPSVAAFKDRIEACLAEVVGACRRSPRADNLMLRALAFAAEPRQLHGFKPLMLCDPAGYRGALATRGSTAIFDAAHDAVTATRLYATELKSHGFAANAIVFVITDGEDNASTHRGRDLGRALAEARASEALDSVTAVLVGVQVADERFRRYLEVLEKEAGFDRTIALEHADAASLARLASFVTGSIAVTSLSLAQGGVLKPPSLTF